MRTRTRPLVATLSGLWILGATAACSTGGASTGAAPAGSATLPDGTYSSSGTYQSPAGTETISVSLTVAHNVVTAVTVTPQAPDPTGMAYQSAFAQGISAVVVGKDINSLNVTRVAGSSLTSGGFNDALQQIKAKAGG